MYNDGMANGFLSKQFLVAMPHRVGGEFDHSVTLLAEHNADGAMGLVINRPTDLTLRDMLAHMGIEHRTLPRERSVFWGGPVQPERGFVLHRPAGDWDATLKLDDDLAITTSKDVLEAIGRGDGPDEYLVMLGYAGWGGGQLEEEIRENSWLNTPADNGIIFLTPAAERWTAAARSIGLDPSHLSGQTGHA